MILLMISITNNMRKTKTTAAQFDDKSDYGNKLGYTYNANEIPNEEAPRWIGMHINSDLYCATSTIA